MVPIQRIAPPLISQDIPEEINQLIFDHLSFLDVLRLKTISKVYRDYVQQVTDKYIERPSLKAYGQFIHLLVDLNFENNPNKLEFLKNSTNQSFLTAILFTICTVTNVWIKPKKIKSVSLDLCHFRKDICTLKKLKIFIENKKLFQDKAKEFLEKFLSENMAQRIRESQNLKLPYMCHLWLQELQAPGALIKPTLEDPNIHQFALYLIIQNIPIGYYYLGLALRFGLDCKVNGLRALVYLLEASKYNIPEAFFETGILFEKLENNKPLAMEYYTKGAELGNADAQNELGVLCLFQNEKEKAIKWFLKAAAQGDPTSQYNLGSLYNEGICFKKDRLKAIKWLKLAAQQGEPDATQLLAELEK